MKKLICVIACFFAINFCHAQTTSKDSLCLDFNKEFFHSRWKIDRPSALYTFEIDTIEKYKGNNSLFVKTDSDDKNSLYTLSQNIYLPSNYKLLEVSIKSKAKTKGSYLKVYTLYNGKQENVDSVFLKNSENWKTNKLRITNSSGRIMNIAIGVKGEVNMWLNNIEIVVDGKKLYDIPNKPVKISEQSISAIKSAQPIDTFSLNYEKQLSTLKRKKIIGIAESLHGSHEMSVWRNQLIKYLVQKENCKLIILEGGNDFVSKLNDYIQNENNQSISLTFDNQAQIYHYTEEMMDLLNWMKNYNRTTDKKITIAGMDIYNDYEQKIRNALSSQKNELFNRLQQSITNPSLLCEEIIKHRKEITDLTSQDFYDNLYKNASRNVILQKVNEVQSFPLRDSAMYEIAKDLVKAHTLPDEKVVICAHFEHLVKQRFFPGYTNLGSYLNSFYKDNYFVVAQLTGSGSYYASLSSNLLMNPVSNSIESFCSHNNADAFYIDLKDIPQFSNTDLLVKSIGGRSMPNQFYPINSIEKNFDAILYIKNSTPLRVNFNNPDDIPFPPVNNQVKPVNHMYFPENDKEKIKDGIYAVSGNQQGSTFIAMDDKNVKIIINPSVFVSNDDFKITQVNKMTNDKGELKITLTDKGVEKFSKAIDVSGEIALILNGRIVMNIKNMFMWEKRKDFCFTSSYDDGFEFIKSYMHKTIKDI